MRGQPVPAILTRIADAWVARRAARTAQPAEETLRPAVVVIGGSRGIGRSVARAFAVAGHQVMIVSRSESALTDAAGQVASIAGNRIETISLDASTPAAPADLEARLAERGLYADVLVVSAGIGLSGRFEDQAAHEIEQLIALNIAALTRHVHHVLPAMRSRARGGVMTIASLGAYVPGPNQATYYASKAYVLSLTEALASELGGSGVRMCVVAPGPAVTGFHAAMGAERSYYRRLLPAMTPERLARSAYVGFVLGRRVVVPGLMMSLAAVVLRLLPHPLTVPLVGWLLAKR